MDEPGTFVDGAGRDGGQPPALRLVGLLKRFGEPTAVGFIALGALAGL